MNAIALQEIGRIPAPGDNVAIATRRLPAGTQVEFGDRVRSLTHTILEGHRFAIEPIAEGEPLLSWGLPFGRALRAIEPGEYVCNAGILEALRLRNLDFALPLHANFENFVATYELDEQAFRPGTQVPLHAERGTFEGYPRPGGRGVGTRNVIVLLGTTSLSGSFVKALEARLRAESARLCKPRRHRGGGAHRRRRNLTAQQPRVRAAHARRVHRESERGRVPGRRLRQRSLHERDARRVHARARLSARARAASLLLDPPGPRGRARRMCADRAPVVRARERDAALGPAALAAPDRPAMRRVGRLLRSVRQSARRLGRERSDPPWRLRQPGRDRRADRSRVLHPREHARPRHGAALPGEDRDLQGARRLARPQRGGQPDRRQQVSRSLQHRDQVDRRGAQEGPGCAPRLRDRLRRAA